VKSLLSPLVVFSFLTLVSSCDNVGKNPISSEAEIPAELAAINERIKSQPNNPDHYVERARYYLNFNDYDKAILDLDRALAADTTRTDILLIRGKTKFSFQFFKEAKDDYEKCILIAPDNTDCLLRKAEMELLLRNYGQALKDINDALRFNDYLEEAYYLKGLYYAEIGDTLLAASSYQTAIEVFPDYYDAYISLGLLYHKAKSDLALEYYNTALSIDPLSFEAFYNKAMYLQETGFRDRKRYRQALTLYDHLAKLSPSNELPYFNRGYIYLEYLSSESSADTTYRKAADFFTGAIERYPGYFQALYNRGLCHESLGEYTRARNDFLKALKIEPQFTEAALSLERLDLLVRQGNN
jgi:tetratricopeptide (TPR) repeat protein